MPKVSVRTKINWGFSIALVLSLVMGLASLVVFRRVRDASRWVAVTQDVRIALESLAEDVTKAESGVRGYVVTGDDAFLKPLALARDSLPVRLAALRRLVADNPNQAARLRVLEPAIAQRLATMDATREARRSGARNTELAPLTKRGQELTARVLATTREMEAEEENLLWARTAAAERLARIAENFVLTASLLGTLVLIAALVAVNRDLRARARAAAALRDAEERSRAVLETVADGIITIDDRGTVETMNPAAERIFGWTAAETAGRNVSLLMPDSYGSRHHSFLERYLSSGEAHILNACQQVSGRRKDGSIFPLELTVSEVRLGERRLFTGILRDVSERRHLEETLNSTLELQQAILDSAANSIISTDADGTILSFNATAERWLGYTADEVVGKTSAGIFHDLKEVERRAIELSAALGEPVAAGFEVLAAEPRRGSASQKEWTYIRKDGSRFPVLLTVAALRKADGAITGFLGIASDLAAQKAFEAAHQESETRYRTVVELLSEGLLVQTTSGVITETNASAERILGCPRESFVGRPAGEAPWQTLREDGSPMPPDERPAAICLRTGQPVRNAIVGARRPDGAFAWILVNVEPIAFGADGRPAAAVSSFSDITRRRLAEEALRENEARLRDFLDNAHDLIVSTSADGRLQYVNSAWERTLGYANADVMGRPIFDFLAPDCRDRCIATFSRVMAGETVSNIEATFVASDGHQVSVLGSSNCRFEDGRPTATRSIFRDITEIRRAQAALERARDDAERANQAKSDFLANMSHELRTPLNSVIGFASVLLKNKAGNFGGQDIDFLRRIQDNGKHLLGLINSILDLSKIEAGKIELEMGDAALDKLVEETLSITGGIPQGGVRRVGEVEVRGEVPAGLLPLRTDGAKLKQVLINLVGNALKFTKQGSVTLRVVADEETRKPLRIDVADTGIGIPLERQSAIFEAFQQADSSTSRQFGGTGLGLTISRSLLQLMGYEIRVSSEPGKGATFSVLFTKGQPKAGSTTSAEAGSQGESAPASQTPSQAGSQAGSQATSQTGSQATSQTRSQAAPSPELLAASEAAARAAEGSEFEGRTVLVIDDDADSRLLLQQMIGDHGARVILASSGEEGLRLARSERPDLITVDLMMPGMNGWEVALALRADPALKDIPAVVVSIVAEERGATVRSAEDLLNKPVSRDHLLSVLRRHIVREQA